MERFFNDIIGIRKNDRIGVDNFPNINKKLYKKLENYYRDIELEERGVIYIKYEFRMYYQLNLKIIRWMENMMKVLIAIWKIPCKCLQKCKNNRYSKQN